MAFSQSRSAGVHGLILSQPRPSPAIAAAANHLRCPGPVPCLTGGRCRTDITLNGRQRHACMLKSGMDLASTSRSTGSFVPSPGANHLGPAGFGRTATDITIGVRHWDTTLDGIGDNARHALKRVMFEKRARGHPERDSLQSSMVQFKDEHGLRTMMQSASPV